MVLVKPNQDAHQKKTSDRDACGIIIFVGMSNGLFYALVSYTCAGGP